MGNPSCIKKLWLALIVASLLFSPFQGFTNAVFCSRIYEASSIYGSDFIPHMRSRFGGSEKAWTKFIENTLTKSPEEIANVHNILRNTKNQNWFRKIGNSLFFFRIQQVFDALDSLHIKNIDLKTIKNWNELKTYERRALLLQSFKKWWWEIDSPHISGFTRWANPSFLIGQILSSNLPQVSLRHRLDELLGGEDSVSLWQIMLKRFSGELAILKEVQNDKESQEILVSTLIGRSLFLKNYLRENRGRINRFQIKLAEIYILKTEVLLEAILNQRILTKSEVKELADSLGFQETVVETNGFNQVVLGNSTILIKSMASIASYMAIGFVVGQFYFNDVSDNRIIVPLNAIYSSTLVE